MEKRIKFSRTVNVLDILLDDFQSRAHVLKSKTLKRYWPFNSVTNKDAKYAEGLSNWFLHNCQKRSFRNAVMSGVYGNNFGKKTGSVISNRVEASKALGYLYDNYYKSNSFDIVNDIDSVFPHLGCFQDTLRDQFFIVAKDVLQEKGFVDTNAVVIKLLTNAGKTGLLNKYNKKPYIG